MESPGPAKPELKIEDRKLKIYGYRFALTILQLKQYPGFSPIFIQGSGN
jgi:hypothetical protein